MRSAQEGRRRHRERAGPRRRLLPAQPGDERLGAWEANPRTCRRMATPRPPHGRIREEETRGGKGRRGGSRKDARGQARPSVCPRAGTHLSPRLRAPPLAASPGSPSCRRGLPPPPSPPPAAPPPPQPGSQRLSPPLSLRSLLSPPCAPHSSSWMGLGAGERLCLHLRPPVWFWEAGGERCASPQVRGHRGL